MSETKTTFPAELSKPQVSKTIRQNITKQGLRIVDEDLDRPWGGFFVIDESQTDQFIDHYFQGQRGRISQGRLSPKILLIAPHRRLSWQYHLRRQELWRIVAGPVAASLSSTDQQPQQPQVFKTGDIVAIGRTQRHRLIGLENWSIVAEIWSHTDPSQPSDENDNIRLQDDFGRQTPSPKQS